MDFFSTLKEANEAREIEWDSGGQLDGSFYSNEMAGEVGEAIEVATDLIFSHLHLNFSMDALADELADVVICINLLGNKLDAVPPMPPSSFEFEASNSVELELLNLAIYCGKACNIAKKLERERLGLVGSRATPEQLREELGRMIWQTAYIAWIFAVNLDLAVALKFNKTSEKLGLSTFMVVPYALGLVE